MRQLPASVIELTTMHCVSQRANQYVPHNENIITEPNVYVIAFGCNCMGLITQDNTKGNSMSNNAPICLETHFKQRLTPVKACIKEKQGVGTSTTNAYDILAVSQGFQNYQTAKGQAAMPFYEWGMDVGSADAPYFITKPIGHHRTANEARDAGQALLAGAPDHIDWILLENGTPTTLTFNVSQAASWDLRDMHGLLQNAISRSISHIRLRQRDDGVAIDYNGKCGWVTRVPTIPHETDVLSTLAELKATAYYVDNPTSPAAITLKVKQGDVTVEVYANVVWSEEGVFLDIRLYDPRASRQHGLRLKGCNAYDRLRRAINESHKGLYLLVGAAGSGNDKTSAHLASEVCRHESARVSIVDDTTLGLDPRTINSAMMRRDPDVVFVGNIRTPEVLANALSAAKDSVVVAHLDTAGAGVLRRLRILGASEEDINDHLQAVYTQRMMRSADKQAMIPVASFQPLSQGELTGQDLFTEAFSLHVRGGISVREMTNQFGPDFLQAVKPA